jgi:hypothetical protein
MALPTPLRFSAAFAAQLAVVNNNSALGVWLCLRRYGFQQHLLPYNAVNTATKKSVGTAIRLVQVTQVV